MKQFEHKAFPEHGGVNLKQTTILINEGNETERTDFVSAEPVTLRHMVKAATQFFSGELKETKRTFSANFGQVIMGLLPHTEVANVKYAIYEELPLFADSDDDDIILVLGTHEENPDVLFMRPGTQRSLDDVLEGVSEGGFAESTLMDGFAIHKDSLGAFEKAVEDAIADLEAQMAE